MSRNFELLQNLGKELDVFLTGSEEPERAPLPAPIPMPVAAVDALPGVDSTQSQLEMEADQKDELNKLVQRVFLTPSGDTPRVVVVASTESGNGSSWVCARIAEILASQVAGPVCVVDANLRSPRLHEEFRVANHHGLSNALRDSGSIRGFVSAVGRSNLWLLSCGADAPDFHSLVGSDRMRMRITELRQEFRYVLIDAPALSGANEGVTMARSAEGIILVLKANTSRREAARKAVQELEDARVRLLGAVLNHRTYPIPDALYKKL